MCYKGVLNEVVDFSRNERVDIHRSSQAQTRAMVTYYKVSEIQKIWYLIDGPGSGFDLNVPHNADAILCILLCNE